MQEGHIIPTEADREAAAALMRSFGLSIAAMNVGLGNLDNSLVVQAFARHAATARAQAREEITTWLHSVARICDCFAREESECACGAWRDDKMINPSDLADAIEAGAHLTDTRGKV